MDVVGRGGLAALRKLVLLLGFGTYFLTCAQSDETPDQTISQGTPVHADEKYAGVFSSLDGTWSGEFIVYEHADLQDYEVAIPHELTKSFLQQLSLREINRIQVEQVYTSLSPYYQAVKIHDTYQESGEKKVVTSTGVNKVEHGELWCVVQKPDEKIVHQGSLPAKDVIVWKRFNRHPLRLEYFYETVLEDTYEIVGYGYYGDDDVRKNPALWFYGKYNRTK